MADTRRRVKLYALNEDRQWDDRGTGHVSSSYVERLKGMSLLVRAESDGSLLLESKIQPDTAYQKQQETLIVWSEADNVDLALSFQEKAGCDEIWEKICQVQGKDPSCDITQDIVEESEEEKFEDMPDAAPPIELPPCELSKLDEISEVFNSVLPSPIRREKLANAIEYEGYIKKIVELFHMCEDLENYEGLHQLYEIYKSIFLLNKNALFEVMFSDEFIFDTVGILEYDPSKPEKASHRDYLRNSASFKEVIPISNEELRQKIHQTYRVQYIQDVVLPTPSVFEENMLSTLSSFIFFNKIEIVSMIQDDEKFLTELFAQLTDEATDDNRRRELVNFLKEFCTFSQTLQPQAKESFFKTLSNLGILPALEVILSMDDPEVRQACTDIIMYIVEYSPSMVREFIMQEANQQDDDILLVNLIIEQMICDPDPELGNALQLSGVLRILIDPENMMATANAWASVPFPQKTEKTEFLSFFYKNCMHVLTAPLLANTTEDKPSKDDYVTAQLLSLILELLAFCVEHHTYHIRNYIFNKDLLRRILVLMKSSHGHLALSALRFVRKIISLKEEFYNRYIIKGNLLKPIVDAFLTNGQRYNLLNSATLELFEFIRVEDIKSLVAYVVETFYEQLKDVDYVNTFKGLKLSVPSILRNHRYRRDARSLDEEEEIWFEQDEEEMEDGEAVVPVTDMLKNKMDEELDHISKIIDGKRARESENKPPSPLKNPTRSPSPPPPSRKFNSSPPAASTSPPASPEVKTNNGGITGLVDYPDEDSDEDEDDDRSSSIPAKRPRLAT